MKSKGPYPGGKEKALERIKAALDSSIGREEKAGRIADAIRVFGEYRWVGIYDVGESEIANVVWSGPGPPAYPRFPLNRGLTGEAVAKRCTIVCNDVASDPHYLPALGNTRSEMIVPVKIGAAGEVIGTLDVEAESKDAFSEADRKFLEECALAAAGLWNTETESLM